MRKREPCRTQYWRIEVSVGQKVVSWLDGLLQWSPFGPIMGWEMRTVARRKRYFFSRALFATLLLIILGIAYNAFLIRMSMLPRHKLTIQEYAQFGEGVWVAFVNLQITAIFVFGPAYLAGSLVIEKERRTLEFLFATNLSNAEIVLGKWAARFLNLTLLLIAGVPVLSFTYLLGGIPYDRLLELFLVLVSALCSVSAISILASAYAKTTRQAIGNGYLGVVMMLIIPMILSWLWKLLANFMPNHLAAYDLTVTQTLSLLNLINPYVAFYLLEWGAQSFSMTFSPFAILSLYVGLHGTITLLCLSVAVLRLRRIYQKELAKSSAPRRRFWWSRRERPAYSVGNWSPMAWREWTFNKTRNRSVLSNLLLLILVVTIYWPVGYHLVEWFSADLDREWTPEKAKEVTIFVSTTSMLLIVYGLIALSVRSAISISNERDKDCWLSLIATPLEPEEILRGKLIGGLRGFLPLVIIMAPALLVASVIGETSLLVLPALIIELFVICTLFASVGMYQSLRRKSSMSAIFSTLGLLYLLTLVLQWIMSLLGIAFYAALSGPLSKSPGFLGSIFLFSSPFTILGGTFYLPPMSEWGTDEFLGTFIGVTANLGFLCIVIHIINRMAASRFDKIVGRTQSRPDRPKFRLRTQHETLRLYAGLAGASEVAAAFDEETVEPTMDLSKDRSMDPMTGPLTDLDLEDESTRLDGPAGEP